MNQYTLFLTSAVSARTQTIEVGVSGIARHINACTRNDILLSAEDTAIIEDIERNMIPYEKLVKLAEHDNTEFYKDHGPF